MSSNIQGNFDNDPNSFGAQGGGRRGGADWGNDPTSGTTFSDSDLGSQAGQQRLGSQGSQGLGSTGQQGYGMDSTAQGDNWTSDTSGGYAGDTTDFNTSGTGGNLSSGQGQYGGTGFDDDSSLGRQQGQGQAGKPSVGDRLKGSMEKMAGKMSGNQAMADRGQDRKTGSNDDYGTSF